LKLFSFFRPTKSPAARARQDRLAQAERSRSVRTEVVRLALRDTLARAKVPADWVAFELLPTPDRAGPQRFHVRLAMRRWDGWLVQAVVEMEHALFRRMKLLDAMCHHWVADISWRFAAPVASASARDLRAPAKPAPRPVDRESLLEPERERQYGDRDTHPDFSPTQPMMR